MHQYKVHLPKSNTWDNEDMEDWFDRSYVEGVNKGMNRADGDDFTREFNQPASLDEIPIDIGGSFTEDRIWQFTAKWWNGRHNGLKIRCWQQRVGSSPTFATIFMKEKIKQLFDNIEPLLSIQLQYADRLDLDTIQITTARARETLKQLRDLHKELKMDAPSSRKVFLDHMDKKFAHALWKQSV